MGEFTLQLAGVFFTFLGVMVGMVKFLLNRIDRCNNKIDGMKGEFLDKESLTPITKRLDDMVSETRRTNNRLDDLMKMMVSSGSKGNV